MNFVVVSTTCGLVCCVLVTCVSGQYQGILINGKYGGTQIYNPFNTPNAIGNLSLGLQPGAHAFCGVATVNDEQLAYFGANGEMK